MVKISMRKLFLASLFLCVGGALASPDDPTAVESAEAWAKVPGILARLAPPEFPHRKFIVTNYGAVGDGATDCTEAFREAIDECSRAGGGEVVVPKGTFLAGAIHLKNNVNLCVEKNATIRFSTNPKDYLPDVFARYEGTEVMNYSPLIYAFDQTNIALTGEGTLDGQGSRAIWYHWKSSDDPGRLVEMAARGIPLAQRIFGDGHHLRPNFIVPFRCRNVLIEGVHIVDSPMWVLNPVYCTNVIIRNVTVETQGPNTDGCDPDSCANVLIQKCNFSDGDDCIAIKSGRDYDGQKVNLPCQNILIQNCRFKAGHGGIAIGSETSGGVQNVFAENCHFDSPDLEMALRFKTNPARGGYIENVYIRDCVVKLARVGIDATLRYGSSGAVDGKTIPVIRNLDIRNCAFSQLTGRPVFIEGWSPSDQITDITIAGCHFAHATEESFVTNAARIYLTGTTGSRLEQKPF
jgi:polygalacturonase